MNKATPKDFPIHPLIERRWSPRSFENRPISPEQIRSLFEAARWSPSSFNAQPWRFVVAMQRDQPATFKKILEGLNERNKTWAVAAPALAIAFAKTTLDDGKPNVHAWYDVGGAVSNLTFQATQFGLSVHQMAGIDHEHIREAFKVPDDFDPIVALAVGFVGNPKRLTPELEKKERSPRIRNGQNSFVFGEVWDDPYRM